MQITSTGFRVSASFYISATVPTYLRYGRFVYIRIFRRRRGFCVASGHCSRAAHVRALVQVVLNFVVVANGDGSVTVSSINPQVTMPSHRVQISTGCQLPWHLRCARGPAKPCPHAHCPDASGV